MKCKAKRIKESGRRVLLTVVLLACFLVFTQSFAEPAKAADPTDEIEHFLITVDVQEDASLLMTYHIDWKVLDDDTYGPLEWVELGLPNQHHSDVEPLGDSISKIEDKGSSLAIYLDRRYYKDEVASFEFSFVQDHMYQIGRYEEGETVFAYTPAWFDSIEIKDLTIRWNADKAGAWQPDCFEDNGYLVFSSAVAPGDRYSITVAYPNDAFAFSVDRQAGGGSGNTDDGGSDLFVILGGLAVLFFFFVLPIVLFVRFVRWIFSGRGFGKDVPESPAPKKRIIRTKIEYYDKCPVCGAAREEGRDDCAYCGGSMIKHRETVEEEDLEKPEAYAKNGTYRYGDSPNTYIHVSVINMPVRPSGRAGCSVKEFFKDSIHRGRVRVEKKAS